MGVLDIVFVVLFIMWGFGGYVPQTPTSSPYWGYGRHALLMILIGIIGWWHFHPHS